MSRARRPSGSHLGNARRPLRTVLCLVGLWLCAAPLLAVEWYDAYDRGLKALRRGRAAEAVEYLQRAIKDGPRPGDAVLTYATNRIAFHPNVHLARAQVLAGNLEAAASALAAAERFKEPAAERAAVAEALRQARERQAAAAAVPPPTVAQAPPPTAPPATPPPPPTTVAHVPTPLPTPVPAPVATLAPAPAARQGSLEVRSEPPGATVLLGDALLGTTPTRKIALDAGTYQVMLRKEGFADQAFTVQVEPSRSVVESRSLIATRAAASPAPEAAQPTLVVVSEPPGASVFLDDVLLGTTDPNQGRLVVKGGATPGRHRLRLSLAGFADHVTEVHLQPEGVTSARGVLGAVRSRWLGPVALTGLAALAGLALLGWRLLRRRAGEAAEAETMAIPGERTPRTATPARTPTPGRTAVAPPTPRRGAGTPRTMPTRAAATPTPGRTAKGDATEGETEALSAIDATPAALFGEFKVLGQLGKGGMASVLKVERRGEVFALKRPLAAFLEDPEFLERFLREAEIGRTLHHPNIIRIFERGEVEGIPYFTMELIEGETLQSHVRQRGPLPPREASQVVAQVAEALDYAHLKGVVHRDLKPSNIMVLGDGAVKVMDYGIARARRFEGLTVTGAFLGTPDYVAPETAEGKGTDARSDLYSLGVVFYEILTGQKPFVGDTPFATLRKHCTEPPTPPSLLAPGTPRELEAIVLRLLHKDPGDRFPGAEELLNALRDYLNRAA